MGHHPPLSFAMSARLRDELSGHLGMHLLHPGQGPVLLILECLQKLDKRQKCLQMITTPCTCISFISSNSSRASTLMTLSSRLMYPQVTAAIFFVILFQKSSFPLQSDRSSPL